VQVGNKYSDDAAPFSTGGAVHDFEMAVQLYSRVEKTPQYDLVRV